MADATTFVTSLRSSVGTVLQDMSYFIAVITSGLVAILGAVPASQNLSYSCELTSLSGLPGDVSS